ncbi:MAG: MFS transporter [Lachnospiraceae bacterium]|nr:MFS transporter [Lachnospiraceae bacterium]
MNEKKYLKWYHKLAYGAGDLASNCSYGLVSTFILIYLTNTMGMNSAIIGTLMLVSKMLDGITDVIFGTLIDHTKSKLGKARPWMLYGQLGVSACLFLVFAIPSGLSSTMQYVYFFVFYTALNAIFYTANGIAYSTLTALITKNPNERVQLGSIRFMFAVVTNIVMGYAVMGGVEKFGGGAAGWRMIALICALIGLVVNTISCLAVKEVPEDENEVEKIVVEKAPEEKLGFVKTAKLLFQNKYYIMILIIYIVYYIMSGLTQGAGVYFMTYVMGDASLLGSFSMMKMFPVIIALAFTPALVKKCGSMQKVNFWGYFLNCVFSVFYLVAAMKKNVPMMLLFLFIKGVFAGTLSGTLNALIAEISAYTYKTKNVHMDGTMYSCSSLGVKVGGGIGTAAVGWLLALSGFDGTAAVQSSGAVNMIFAMYVTIPLAIGVIITVLLGMLDVEKKNKELDALKQKA